MMTAFLSVRASTFSPRNAVSTSVRPGFPPLRLRTSTAPPSLLLDGLRSRRLDGLRLFRRLDHFDDAGPCRPDRDKSAPEPRDRPFDENQVLRLAHRDHFEV